MKKYGTEDDDVLGEYVRFRKIVKRRFKQAVTYAPPELVQLVVPGVEDVRRGLKRRVDALERAVLEIPGEAIWYAANRRVWDETLRILKDDDFDRECLMRACSAIDLKKLPLLVLIKIVEPMGIFHPDDIAAAIRAHALDTHSRLQEISQEVLDVDKRNGIKKPRTAKRNLSSLKSVSYEQRGKRLADRSRSSGVEDFWDSLSSSDLESREMVNCALPVYRILSDDEEHDPYLFRYVTPEEFNHETRRPNSAVNQASTDEESAADENNDGSVTSTFSSKGWLDSLGSDVDEPTTHPGVSSCYCYYS